MSTTAVTVATASAAHAATERNTLKAGATLKPGERLVSQNRCFTLEMQRDGNVVQYGPRHSVVWATGTFNHPGARLAMQHDGNLVLYGKKHEALWASLTQHTKSNRLALQNDGNTVLYAPRVIPTWSQGTTRGCGYTAIDSPRAEAAINWMLQHAGTTSLDGRCERAVALAFDRIDNPALPDARADWFRFAEHHTDPNPPRGALVFWQTSAHWHVGISLGNGQVVSTSSQQFANGHGSGIGVSPVHGFFAPYVGWVPSGL